MVDGEKPAIIPMIQFVIEHGQHAASPAQWSNLLAIGPSDTHIGVSVDCGALVPEGLTLSRVSYPEGGGATMLSLGSLQPQAAPTGFLVGDPVIADDGHTVLFEVGNGHQDNVATYEIKLQLTIGSSLVVIIMTLRCE